MDIQLKFKLKNPKSEGLTSIQLYFYHNKKRFVYSLGNSKRIYPELWDRERMQPLSKKDKRFASIIKPYQKEDLNIKNKLTNIETRIKNIETTCQSYFNQCELDGKSIDFKELKTKLQAKYSPQKEQAKTAVKSDDLIKYLQKLIVQMKDGTVFYTSKSGENKKYKKDTVKAYKVLHTKLMEYLSERKLSRLKFEMISSGFYQDFQNHMNSYGFTPNYFGNLIKSLKATLKRAENEGYNVNTEYKSFKKTKNETTCIYLTEEELSVLSSLELSENHNLDKVRDLFLIGCWTAQRFSDYSRYTKEMITTLDTIKCISFHQTKGGNRVVIPLKPSVLRILEKYDFNSPHLSEQHFNRTLKVLGKLANINDQIEIKEIKGGVLVTQYKPKYELLSSHVARRTGCTLMHKNNMPTKDIMAISGHKTETEFNKYIGINKEERASRASENAFFH